MDFNEYSAYALEGVLLVCVFPILAVFSILISPFFVIGWCANKVIDRVCRWMKKPDLN